MIDIIIGICAVVFLLILFARARRETPEQLGQDGEAQVKDMLKNEE